MQEFRSKIILVGTVGVGKTSLIRRFVYQLFSDTYLSTIGVRVDKKTIIVDSKKVHLMVWDLAGEIISNKAYSSYLRGSQGILGVFDVTRPNSYVELQDIMLSITKENPKLNKIIVGNKVDLLSDPNSCVEKYETNFCTSAKTGKNVDLIFEEMANLILSNYEKVY